MTFATFIRKRAQKVFINDSVYKVLAIVISDVAEVMFYNGFLGIMGAPFGQKGGNDHICLINE